MKKNISNNFFTLFIFSFCISAVVLSCSEKRENKTNEKEKYIIPDSSLKNLVFDTVKTERIVNDITLTGSVDFDQDHQVNIFPLVSGVINGIKVQLGDYVHAGQVLAVVNSSEMAGYSNNLIVAETNLSTAKKQLDATQDLFKSGLSSQLDVTNAQANYDQAVSQLEMAKRVLKINGDNTKGNYIVKAPISGFIVQKNVVDNTSIRTDNGNNLFTISDLKDVWIQANVYESNINNVHLGVPVSITTLSYPGKVFYGKIDKIVNVLDPASKVMKVRIVIPNPDYALKPAMFASVTVTNALKAQAFCITNNALVFDHSQYYVLKYNGKGNADIKQVNVLSTFGNKIYISEGVKEGDVLVASNTLQFYDQLNN